MLLILGVPAFDLDRIVALEPDFLDEGAHEHEHDDGITSISLKANQPIDPNKFMPWVQKLVAERGPDILRTKGILSLKDEPCRFVLQGVHMLLEGDTQRPWREDEQRESRLVFIGRDLPAAELEQGFARCLVA